MKIFYFVGLICCLGGVAAAQLPVPEPVPLPGRRATTPEARNAELERQKRREQEKTIREQLGGGAERDAELRNQATEAALAELYRHSTDKERQSLTPEAEILRKYADFLTQPRTGLVKLAANTGCSGDQMILDASADCMRFSMPGAGAAYSFRMDDYRIRRLADIAVADGFIEVGGQMNHGIIVDLGRIDPASVSLTTDGLPFLLDFKPAKDMKSAQRIQDALTKGVDSKGLRYANRLHVSLDSTFAMRSIAYRADYLRSYNGKVYDEFKYDRRLDVVVVLKVVAIAEDGSPTLLWRELSRKKAPKMNLQ